MTRNHSTFVAICICALALAGKPDAFAGYVVETIPMTDEIRGGITATGFTPKGTQVITTRFGEAWMRAPRGNKWRRFASGLNEPMGLVAESESVVYIAHRPELLRCADTNGDGKADDFTSIAGEWGHSSNYHEFFYGLRRDSEGNFFGAVSLPSTGDKSDDDIKHIRGPLDTRVILAETGHRSDLLWRGWAIRITPEGRLDPFASGFRQPNGIGLGPDGSYWTTDNQGDWKPSGGLLHVERGDFFGHVSSLKWEPGFSEKELTIESAWKRLKPPAVVLPHGVMGISNGEPVWDETAGRFGPFSGQIFVCDYSPIISRATLQKVAGEWQGASYPFLGSFDLPGSVVGDTFQGGATRMAFGPDGALYAVQTAGWGAGHDGMQRISWNKQPTPEIESVSLLPDGFLVTFTAPMERPALEKPSNFELHRFRYYYHSKYGSPRVDETAVGFTPVEVASSGLAVKLAVADLQPGFVYELSMPQLRAQDGGPLNHSLAFYTANRLVTGEIAIGGTTRLPRENETSDGAERAMDEEMAKPEKLLPRGEKVYRTYCAPCHQPNGRGLPGGAADFVGDKTRLAKSDAELLHSIGAGVEAKAMPAFGAILSPYEQSAVLAYIRTSFGVNSGKKE